MIRQKADILATSIDSMLGIEPGAAMPVDDVEVRELLHIAKLRQELGASRRALALREKERVWQRIQSTLTQR